MSLFFKRFLRGHPGFLTPFIATKLPAVRWPTFSLCNELQSASLQSWGAHGDGQQAFQSSWLGDSRGFCFSLQRERRGEKSLIPWRLQILKAFKGSFVGNGMVNHWGWFQKSVLRSLFLMSFHVWTALWSLPREITREGGWGKTPAISRQNLSYYENYRSKISEHSLWELQS